MKTAYLEILGITVPLKKNDSFTDEGFVDNIEDRVKELHDRHKLPYKDIDFANMDGYASAFCVGQFFLKSIHVYIMYRKLDSVIETICTRGHEEAHALFAFQKTKMLQEKIKQAGLPEPPVRLSTLEEEIFAEYGGYYALLLNGCSHEQAKAFLSAEH